MELTFKIETDDLHGEDGMDFESLLTDSLRREVIKTCKKELVSDKFNEFASLASDTVIAGVKLKLENFLSEEISLTEKWGKTTFVGSIEDLIKQRFDDVLLRPVDGQGKTVQGCTSSGKTWIEWRIEKDLEGGVVTKLNEATRMVERAVREHVDGKIIEMKDTAIKRQVDAAFTAILKQS